MLGDRWRVAFLWLLAFWSLSELPAQSVVRTAENGQFEIVGFHPRSVSYVEELSRLAIDRNLRYLNPEGFRFPQRILVNLKPTEFIDFEGDYLVRVKERGFVSLDVHWSASLSLETICYALSEVLLVRYSIFNYGIKGPEHLPEWIVSALATDLYLGLRPAQWLTVAARSRKSDAPELTELITRNWKDPTESAEGYLFLSALETNGLSRSEIRMLIDRNLNGINILQLLPGLIRGLATERAEAVDPAEWWPRARTGLLEPRDEWMETMETSRLWIEALSDFSDVDGQELNLAELWKLRQEQAVRDVIEARYELLRLRILRVNPVYFNAARSLGAVFEMLLSEEGKRHRYIHQMVGFFSDFEDNKLIEETVSEALDTSEK